MTPTVEFISKLENLKEGQRSCLRRLAGLPLDKALQGFDVFTGLWWPLRHANPATPRRETSWLVAKLYGMFPIPHVRPHPPADQLTLARLLRRCEPRDDDDQERFRKRFDALICSPLSCVEPHLHWALRVIARAVAQEVVPGMDWAQLLDDLSIWDRGEEHRRERDVRDIWAEQYLQTMK